MQASSVQIDWWNCLCSNKLILSFTVRIRSDTTEKGSPEVSRRSLRAQLASLSTAEQLDVNLLSSQSGPRQSVKGLQSSHRLSQSLKPVSNPASQTTIRPSLPPSI